MTEQTSAMTTTQRVESVTIIKAREIASRVKYMIVNGSKLSDQEVFALAHYSAANDLSPFAQECYYLPGTGPVPGIVGLRRKAQEALNAEAERAKITEPQGYWTDTRPALPGEANFDADKDIAVFVTLHDSITNKRWRRAYFETARELKELGEKEYFTVAKEFVGPEPVWTGVGVVYGMENFGAAGKEKFDRYERAAKRAEKVALKKRFQSLHALDTASGDIDDDIVDTTFQEVMSEPEKPKLSQAELMRQLGYDEPTTGNATYTGPTVTVYAVEPAPEPPPADEQAHAEPAQADDTPYVYTGRGAKVGKNQYPSQWARLVMAYKRANEHECDGILQKLRLPFETKPDDVITAINEYLDAKAQA